MERIEFWLDMGTAKRLEKAASVAGMSIEEWIRFAVARFMERCRELEE